MTFVPLFAFFATALLVIGAPVALFGLLAEEPEPFAVGFWMTFVAMVIVAGPWVFRLVTFLMGGAS